MVLCNESLHKLSKATESVSGWEPSTAVLTNFQVQIFKVPVRGCLNKKVEDH